MKTEILGLHINTDRKEEVLSELDTRLKAGLQTVIVTPYSEFFLHSFKDHKFQQIINNADIAIPDGIAPLWLSLYLKIPFQSRTYILNVIEGFVHLLFTIVAILLQSDRLKEVFPEKIPGSEFFWDLIRYAEKNNQKVFLLGGWPGTAEKVIEEVRKKYPTVEFSGFDSSNYNHLRKDSELNNSLVDKINATGTGILMVAFGPVKQEKWIHANQAELNAKVLIGVGGTFDYVAGIKKSPHPIVREMGLEWLHRLITQPYRLKRIVNATLGLMRAAWRYKVFMNQPYRPNAVGVIINKQGEVLIATRIMTKQWSSEHPGKNTETHWQLPQGGIEDAEDPELAVLREMREEVGLTDLTVIGKAPEKYSYIWPNVMRPVFNTLPYKGQEQIIYYLKLNSEQEVKLDNHEFNGYKWVEPRQLMSMVHPIRHKMLEIVLKYLPEYHDRTN
jgi:N-acetylglucosaminyldiphosphoundecaprenol N-acetyl-beta-D-mannosaminyltransferase